MQFTELNIEAIKELKKRPDVRKIVWVWNESWIRTDALEFNSATSDSPVRAFCGTQFKDSNGYHSVPTFNTKKFLYVVSDTQPDWDPNLLTLSQATRLVTTLDLSLNTWCLDKHGWSRVGNLLSTDLSDKYVYLIQTNEPTYHPLQQEIAKLVLQGNKISESEPERAPTTVMERIGKIRIGDHKYSKLIAQLAENPYLPLFRFNDDKGYWVQIDNPFLESNHYAIGEKPTEPPVPQMKMLKVKVVINNSSYTFDLEVPTKANEKEISEAVNQAILAKIVTTYEVIKEQQVSN